MKKKVLNFTVLIEQDEDGIYVAKVPDIIGCYTQGKTVKQAMKRIKEAIQVCIEADDPGSFSFIWLEPFKKCRNFCSAAFFYKFWPIVQCGLLQPAL
ncbi:MAG TPA: type II toxin-antitoxin system HicB family antitoxin [Candidatus Methanoperedens sp.]|nr:type II toxin-antitoxin system HicB family antitoxin [Candidatus Methanoperedens sp.]